ncbi:hypothetical protein AYI68_g1364 [Smittium mucronatum]|uniref:Uncharacterized protein n=1 Tax=Smittium mucronatum TaxID=133383 RepID=A0A1R0H5S4_9FUNG|nr:hypothetical protein AYI68_g1364 [Smittium mucronatum]
MIIYIGSILFSALSLFRANSATIQHIYDPTLSPNEAIGLLHQEALIEGGELIVYSGGDGSNSSLDLTRRFNQRFPGMNLTLMVNLSKHHNIEIDDQLANGTLIPSVAHLQTVNDFYRWKDEGRLLPFKPPHWDQVYPEIKDPEYHFTSLNIISFSPNALACDYENGNAPVEDLDFLDPKYKNRIVMTYPNDDDAVLYQFDKIISKYGWQYVEKLVAQNVTWVRGTGTPLVMINNGTISNGVTFTSGNSLAPAPDARVVARYPTKSWFLTWGQTAAIFRDAPHPAAAKLFIAWYLSDEVQNSNSVQWSSRMDIPPKNGFKQVQDYPNTSPRDFITFMLNRPHVEYLRFRFERLIGTPQGQSPLLDPNQ